jgi:hypothetical protein
VLLNYNIGNDSMLSLVLHLHGGGGKDIPSLSKGYFFNDAVNRKPSIVVPIHPPNVYIVDKVEEVPVLEIIEDMVFNLLSHYESRVLIF